MVAESRLQNENQPEKPTRRKLPLKEIALAASIMIGSTVDATAGKVRTCLSNMYPHYVVGVSRSECEPIRKVDQRMKDYRAWFSRPEAIEQAAKTEGFEEAIEGFYKEISGFSNVPVDNKSKPLEERYKVALNFYFDDIQGKDEVPGILEYREEQGRNIEGTVNEAWGYLRLFRHNSFGKFFPVNHP